MGRGQCTSSFHSKNGTIFFCLKKPRHTGDHRGERTQWNHEGKKVKITEPQPR